jgi:hypothetical protein
VKIPNGTATVSAEAVLVDESRSLGNREGRAQAAGDVSISASQETCFEIGPYAGGRKGRLLLRKNGCNDQMIVTAVLFIVI